MLLERIIGVAHFLADQRGADGKSVISTACGQRVIRDSSAAMVRGPEQWWSPVAIGTRTESPVKNF